MRTSMIVAFAGVAAAAATASAATVRPTTQSFVQLADSDANRVFAAEGRIGNNALNGTFEAVVGPNTGLASNPTAQRTWTSGQAASFTLTYTGGLVTWSIPVMSPNSISYQSTGTVNSLIIRALANRADASIELSNMSIQGLSGLSLSDTFGTNSGFVGYDTNASHLIIDGIVGDFVLTGEVTMTWSGSAPTNSNLAFQIKGSEYTLIPLPSAGALSLAGLALVGSRRRSR